MRTEFHCQCGHREALQPAKLKNSLRCGTCGAESVFVVKGSKQVRPSWLLVGRSGGDPELALPIPVGQTVKVGAREGLWLVLEGIEPVQAQLTLEADGRMSIKDVAHVHNTWINRAKILTGVITPGDVLVIGDWRLALRADSARKAATPTIDPDMVEVVVEDADDATGSEPAIEDERPDTSSDDYISGESTRRWKIRSMACIGIICAAAAYWAWALGFSTSVSVEMPETTLYRCPADGTLFRGSWKEGSAKCPQCGALCFGTLKYKPESTGRAKPTSIPTRNDERVAPSSSPTTKKKPTARKPGDGARKKSR
jgi:hypothetical protein